MNDFRRVMSRTAVALAMALVWMAAGAQAAGPGSGPGPGPGAGPGAGMGPGAGAGGPGRGPRYGADVTPGWALMTEAERNEHRTRMQAIKTHEECVAEMARHRESMAARAKERGQTLPTPRGDPCRGFRP
jgi:hypothetical protein